MNPKHKYDFLLDESLSRLDWGMKSLGISLEKDGSVLYDYYIIFIINCIMYGSDVIGAICWFIKGARMGESITSLTYVAPCVTLSFLAILKSFCLIFYKKSIRDMLRSLRDLEKNERRRPKCLEKEVMIKKEMNFLHTVLKYLNLNNYATMIAFPSMPLITSLFLYIKNKELVLLLPLLILYPFNEYDFKVFPFVFLKQTWSVCAVVIIMYCSDFFYYIISSHIKVQFNLLAYELEGLIPKRGTLDDEGNEEVDVKTKLEDIILWHQELIRLVDSLEQLMNKPTLFNFVTSSALICLTGFNVTTMEDKAFVISFICFLFLSIMQIFFLCFFGDRLMRASMEVSDSAYKCKWYLASTKTAKILFLIQTRAQKPCRLTAYGFADVNLRAFTKILSTAWSYFALLKTVYTTEED